MSARAHGRLTGAGGPALFWQSWRPAAPPRARAVIVHGAGEHSDRYGQLAAALVDDGLAVYALDHRGHGRSQGPRGLIDRIAHVIADLDRFVTGPVADEGRLPMVMIGHSMGALLAVEYALAHQRRLTALVLSGTLATIDASPALRRIGRALSAIAPTLPLRAIDPALVSRDPAVVAAYRADPLVHHRGLPARTAAELLDATDELPARVGAITLPTLLVHGTADGLCPVRGSAILVERLGSVDKTLALYDGLRHEVFHEPGRAAVLADVRAWLQIRLAAAGG